MAEINDHSKVNQIRNLLIVLGSAVGLAVAIMLSMLYSYGPAGTYLAKNVILSPISVKGLNFEDFNPNTGTNSHFVFDLIEFSYYDIRQKKIKRVELDDLTYAELYKLIENDNSLLKADTDLDRAFNNAPAILSFKVRADDNVLDKSSKDLFEVDFVKDYYRITLRGQNADRQWVYYKHENILERVLKIVISK